VRLAARQAAEAKPGRAALSGPAVRRASEDAEEPESAARRGVAVPGGSVAPGPAVTAARAARAARARAEVARAARIMTVANPTLRHRSPAPWTAVNVRPARGVPAEAPGPAPGRAPVTRSAAPARNAPRRTRCAAARRTIRHHESASMLASAPASDVRWSSPPGAVITFRLGPATPGDVRQGDLPAAVGLLEVNRTATVERPEPKNGRAAVDDLSLRSAFGVRPAAQSDSILHACA
jgi:hypothetical protein